MVKEAAHLGIHRTAHAGETGCAKDVVDAIKYLKAERIGHEYHLVDDEKCYNYVRQSGIHLECCPLSSYLTNSVHISIPYSDHPLQKFRRDKMNFSISTDDPVLTGFHLADEIKFAKTNYGFTEMEIAELQVKAAEAAFLPLAEKIALVQKIKQANNV